MPDHGDPAPGGPHAAVTAEPAAKVESAATIASATPETDQQPQQQQQPDGPGALGGAPERKVQPGGPQSPADTPAAGAHQQQDQQQHEQHQRLPNGRKEPQQRAPEEPTVSGEAFRALQAQVGDLWRAVEALAAIVESSAAATLDSVARDPLLARVLVRRRGGPRSAYSAGAAAAQQGATAPRYALMPPAPVYPRGTKRTVDDSTLYDYDDDDDDDDDEDDDDNDDEDARIGTAGATDKDGSTLHSKRRRKQQQQPLRAPKKPAAAASTAVASSAPSASQNQNSRRRSQVGPSSSSSSSASSSGFHAINKQDTLPPRTPVNSSSSSHPGRARKSNHSRNYSNDRSPSPPPLADGRSNGPASRTHDDDRDDKARVTPQKSANPGTGAAADYYYSPGSAGTRTTATPRGVSGSDHRSMVAAAPTASNLLDNEEADPQLSQQPEPRRYYEGLSEKASWMVKSITMEKRNMYGNLILFQDLSVAYLRHGTLINSRVAKQRISPFANDVEEKILSKFLDNLVRYRAYLRRIIYARIETISENVYLTGCLEDVPMLEMVYIAESEEGDSDGAGPGSPDPAANAAASSPGEQPDFDTRLITQGLTRQHLTRGNHLYCICNRIVGYCTSICPCYKAGIGCTDKCELVTEPNDYCPNLTRRGKKQAPVGSAGTATPAGSTAPGSSSSTTGPAPVSSAPDAPPVVDADSEENSAATTPPAVSAPASASDTAPAPSAENFASLSAAIEKLSDQKNEV